MEWIKAKDITKEISSIIKKLNLTHIDPNRIIAFRSFGSKTQARARIWSFPRVWQLALDIPAHYVIEVISSHYDHLSGDDKTRVLIHELLHIPSNFSGSLVPHRGRGRRIDSRRVESLFQVLKKC